MGTYITIDLDSREITQLQKVLMELETLKYTNLQIKKSSKKGYHIKAWHKKNKSFKEIIKDRTQIGDDQRRINYDKQRQKLNMPTQVLFNKKINITNKLKKELMLINQNNTMK